MNRRLIRGLTKVGTSVVLGLSVVALTASQAVAAPGTSNASANAIGGNVLNTGTCVASNNGSEASPGTRTGPCTTGGTGSNGSLISAAVLVADAIANNDATSYACAGVTGPGGGAIQVGPSDPCTVNGGTGQGVNLISQLVTADAVYATCSDVNGTLSGASTLANLSIGGPLANLLPALGVVSGLGALPTNPVVNFSQPISLTLLGTTTPLLTVNANTQTTVNGVITVTALDIKVLPGLVTLLPNLGLTNGLEISIGTVTCGPNAVLAPVSSFPAKGLPIAGGVLAIVGGAAWLGRRRLFATD